MELTSKVPSSTKDLGFEGCQGFSSLQSQKFHPCKMFFCPKSLWEATPLTLFKVQILLRKITYLAPNSQV